MQSARLFATKIWKTTSGKLLRFMFIHQHELNCELYILLLSQNSLPLFKVLAQESKIMEGEDQVLSCRLWLALRNVEAVFAPDASDSSAIADLRAAMYADHFTNRVTLNKSVTTPLHVLMHLLDHRYCSAFPSFFIYIINPMPVFLQLETKSPWCSFGCTV